MFTDLKLNQRYVRFCHFAVSSRRFSGLCSRFTQPELSVEQRVRKLSFPHHTYKIQPGKNECFTCLSFVNDGYVLSSAYFEDILFS